MTARTWLILRAAVAAVGFLAGAAIAFVAGEALIIYVPYAAVGALLVIQRPRHPIGWLLATIAWVIALGFLPVNATAPELTTLSAPPMVLAVAWFKWWWSFPLTFTLLAALAISFPSGRLPVGRWRRPAVLLLGAMAAITLAAAVWPELEVIPDGISNEPFRMPNPLRLLPADVLGSATDAFSGVAGPVLFALLIMSIASVLVRYRWSSGTERLQLQWLVAGLGSVAAAIPLGFLLFAVFGPSIQGLAWLPAIVAFTLPPFAVGFAVTHYRLYEIDRIISRGLSWAVLSGILIAVYASAVLILQGALAGATQGQTLAVAASTLLAAALFQPLRRRIQMVVDHRFDRERYDGERTADAFAERLRGQVDLTGLKSDVVHTVTATLRPSSTGLWIRGASR